MKGHLLVVDSASYTLDLLAALRREGLEVTFVRSALRRGMYQGHPRYAELMATADRVVDIADPTDDAELGAAVEAVHRRHPVDGALTVLDVVVPALSRVAARLGIRCTDPAAVRRAKRKDECRATLDAAGIPSARFRRVRDERDLGAAAGKVGFPAVLKPVSAAASAFATIVTDPEELSVAWRRFRDGRRSLPPRISEAFGADAVLEEYLDGALVSYEVVVVDGVPRPLGVSETVRAASDETVELAALIPAPLPARELDAVREYGDAVVRALRFDLGILHLEMIITAAGPRLVEVNPRLVGGIDALAFGPVYGFDTFRQLAAVHLGESLAPWSLRPRGVAVNHFVCAAEGGRVRTDFDPERAAKEVSHLTPLAEVRLSPGQELAAASSEFDWHGYVMAFADDWPRAAAACSAALTVLGEHVGVPLLDGFDPRQRVPLSTDGAGCRSVG